MGQGANSLPLEKHHDSAQPHLGQQVQTDQTIHLTPNALPSPCKLAYQQQALRLRQQNTSATTDILVRAGRGRGFSSFAPRTVLFHVLCKTASSQCLLMVSAGWQLVLQGAFASPLITGGWCAGERERDQRVKTTSGPHKQLFLLLWSPSCLQQCLCPDRKVGR